MSSKEPIYKLSEKSIHPYYSRLYAFLCALIIDVIFEHKKTDANSVLQSYVHKDFPLR
jgi:hypothetical protein